MSKITNSIDENPIKSRFNIGKYVVNSEMSYEMYLPIKERYGIPVTPEDVLIDEFLDHTKTFASIKPIEFATILNSLDSLPFFYLHAHGHDFEGRWIYAPIKTSDNYPKISVEERLANEQAGGALLVVCNPGGYVLRNISFPVMYPLIKFSLSDIEEDPNRMTLGIPEGMTTVQPEKALDAITDYLNLLCQLDISIIRGRQLPEHVSRDREKEYYKLKKIVGIILTTKTELSYLDLS